MDLSVIFEFKAGPLIKQGSPARNDHGNYKPHRGVEHHNHVQPFFGFLRSSISRSTASQICSFLQFLWFLVFTASTVLTIFAIGPWLFRPALAVFMILAVDPHSCDSCDLMILTLAILATLW
ncbi:hypothetical protein C1645_840786 [Glomus cerebriforme]|uniref:Uncharacterized protein n=1 Tax=Glomus cerebriforme TaxID=658196 RepID=A0A397S1J9_9GLOM|nr:hypothetical protein C1645_840786 [Glomus cerebriforme]